MTTERFEVQRQVVASPAAVFALLSSPQGHVAIDSSGMLQSAEGDAVKAVGDEFVVHMDREALNDYPMGKYDVTVIITKFEQDAADRVDDLGGDPAADPAPVRIPAGAQGRRHAGDHVLRLE